MSLTRLGLRLFALLPRPVRRVLVRLGTPSYTVGAVGVVVDGDRVLLVRLSYRAGWAVPGGLLDRGETAEGAVVRELWEEVGVAIVIDDRPRVLVDPRYRRVDVCFACSLATGVDPDAVRPTSPEIAEVGWFPLSDLPRLQPEAVRALQQVGYVEEVSRWLRRTPPEAPSGRRGGEAW